MFCKQATTRYMYVVVITAVSQILIDIVCGFRTGAPLTSCIDMVPKHGYTPKTKNCPFAFKLFIYRLEDYTELVRIMLYSKVPDVTFTGFVMNVRDRDHEVYGNFMPVEGADILDCEHMYLNTATHEDAEPKSVFNLTWKKPTVMAYKRRTFLRFHATFVKSLEECWIGIRSQEFTINKIYSVQQSESSEI